MDNLRKLLEMLQDKLAYTRQLIAEYDETMDYVSHSSLMGFAEGIEFVMEEIEERLTERGSGESKKIGKRKSESKGKDRNTGGGKDKSVGRGKGRDKGKTAGKGKSESKGKDRNTGRGKDKSVGKGKGRNRGRA